MTTSDISVPGHGASELDDARKRVRHLEAWRTARSLALPVTASSAVLGLFVPALFPVITAAVAAGLVAGKIYSDRERKILDEEIGRLRAGGIADGELRQLSSSANTATVGGSST
jgi:hypothetical protein